MPKLPSLKPRDVIGALEQAGFHRVRQKGSHVQLKKGNLLVTVPTHTKALPAGTLRSILRQARMSIDELNELL
ncbi:MAG: type II toxin-antitoxin system HicA family toxin [Chloroflexi bacterium]|nr:type II toxin-antitoxin system HicA family toxin [Chloroflexota bacterium]